MRWPSSASRSARGALVGTVTRGGPAAKAGIEPGDIILEFNGKPVQEPRRAGRDRRRAPSPASTVPVKVLRDKQEKTLSLTVDELNLDDEGNRAARRSATATEPDEQPSQGFGITLSALTPDMARRLRAPSDTEGVLVSDVEQGSPAFRAGLARGDIITAGQPPAGAHAAGGQPRARPGAVGRHGVPARACAAARNSSSPSARNSGTAGMALEREIKLRFDSADEARAKILALGATPLHGRRLQEDCLLDTDDELLRRQRSTLRVRSEGGKSLLTFKGPVHARARSRSARSTKPSSPTAQCC